MNPLDELDPKLMEKLNLLQETPERDPQKANAGRTAFLQQAQQYASSVTRDEKLRHNNWFTKNRNIPVTKRKERSFMFSFLSVILITASLILGGGGLTVAAAQSSDPGDPLYSVKLWSEDVRMDLTSDNESQYELALDFADRRVEEIQDMLISGEVPIEAVPVRLQTHLEQAIQAALGMPDDKAIQALEQIRTRMETQLQLVMQMQTSQPLNQAPVMIQTSTMLQERLNWLGAGLSNPSQLREEKGIHQQTGQPAEEPPTAGNNYGPATESGGSGPTGSGDGNPWTTGTPTPGSSYGPGPGTGEGTTCTPAGTGSGYGSGNQTPGSSSGSGGNK